ncbi:hypothetical protein CRM22_008295 [Opisthorchis felineus]|uniref:Uncharacterized protein n=1 Tax=Opisthorchis felineus TaxID=147828 RepID=A0A4S2LCA7_OPIFE|nr:hypothetical protein CRM22_008295 [Opisthorchis felineus]
MLHVFVSSSSGNPHVKNKQQYVLNLLSALKIPYKTRDISQCEEDKQFMMKVLRELGKPVIAPQLFFDNEYIGPCQLTRPIASITFPLNRANCLLSPNPCCLLTFPNPIEPLPSFTMANFFDCFSFVFLACDQFFRVLVEYT